MKQQNKFSYLREIKATAHVLIAPLNWGLGHASRCIPIIRELQQRGNTITIASDGIALELLQKEFPTLSTIALPGYKVHYKGNFLVGLIMQSPKIAKAVYQEHRQVQKIVADHAIDVIISDNRYGVRHKSIPSIIVIHQINILLSNPIVQWCGRIVNKYLINRFDQCWIPDRKEQPLAGVLSSADGLSNALHIGTLSRMHSDASATKVYDLCIILSGPEPRRTHLENTLLSILADSDHKVKLIRGTQSKLEQSVESNNISVIDMASSIQINQSINQSEIIISRSGYTTVMDLQAFDKKCILIPTPGQTEQEYLADQLVPPFYKLNEQELNKSLLPLIESLIRD